MMKIRIILSALAAVFFVSPVSAAVVTYTLQDVTFEDGGTASGSFDYDTDTMLFSNISIVTTAGTLFDGTTHFSHPPFAITGVNAFFVDSDATGSTGLPTLTDATSILLGIRDGDVFTSLLPDLGISSVIALDLIAEGTCTQADCFRSVPFRSASSGFLVTDDLSQVPLPAALPLFLFGLSGLGFTTWRKRSGSGGTV